MHPSPWGQSPRSFQQILRSPQALESAQEPCSRFQAQGGTGHGLRGHSGSGAVPDTRASSLSIAQRCHSSKRSWRQTHMFPRTSSVQGHCTPQAGTTELGTRQHGAEMQSRSQAQFLSRSNLKTALSNLARLG